MPHEDRDDLGDLERIFGLTADDLAKAHERSEQAAGDEPVTADDLANLVNEDGTINEEIAKRLGVAGPSIDDPVVGGFPTTGSGRIRVQEDRSDDLGADFGFLGGVTFDGIKTGLAAPRYFENDLLKMFSMNSRDMTALQEKLVTAGVMKAGSFQPGIFDDTTQAAVRSTMGFANITNRDIDQMLVELAGTNEKNRDNIRADAIRAATARFVRQDDATIRSTVEATMEQMIGRAPTDMERRQIAAAFRQFESEDLAAQQQHAASVAEFSAGITDTVGTLQDVDPKARLESHLAERFAGTIEANEEVEHMRVGKHNLRNMTQQLARLIANG